MENKRDDLLRHLSQLNQVRPNDLQAAFMTATAYAQIGLVDEAKKIAEMLYKQFPDILEIRSLYERLSSVGETSGVFLK